MIELTKEQHSELIKACNLLCEFTDKHLPPSFEIRLCMFHGEASLQLFDPSGNEVWIDAADYGCGTFVDMCDIAIEKHDELKGGS